MKLTPHCKLLMDAIKSIPCDVQGRYYSVDVISEKIPDKSMTEAEFWATLETAENDKLLRFADRHRSCIMMLEKGYNYKVYQRLERAEKWKERLLGFFSGAALTVLAWVLTIFIK